jgi:molecular chaperone HtpG
MNESAGKAEQHVFKTEVARLLDLVVNALYSKKEIFLRELVSNASDACDRLRYAALTEPALLAEDPELGIRIRPDAKARTLTVTDNGVGMSRDELIEHLGTIAGSGTAAFMAQLTGDKAKDVALIGQFGVGFYAAFMVAAEVAVTSRRAGADESWTWRSDGKGAFRVEPAAAHARGTSVVLHLKRGEDEYLEPARLEHIVRTYSDHIGLPILLEGEGAPLRINDAGALWTRPKDQITPEQYREFYRHVAHAGDDPWLNLHNRNEGTIEYTNLLFVPNRRPYDLFMPDRRHRVKLYVKRVFITDDCQDLLPPWLRFLAGVVDCQDLPLNISRETLQANPVIARIRQRLVKRVLGELKRKAKDDAPAYATFWDAFGAVLKEGVYEDHARREELLGLVRFHTTAGDGLVGLADYVGRMKPGQNAIYTISGDDPKALAASPQLEAFKAKGVEVLLLTDAVDEFWVPAVGKFQDKPFESVTRGDLDLGAIQGAGDAPAAETATKPKVKSLIAVFKLALGDKVKDVRASQRLTDSPVCLVADRDDLDLHVERLLRQHQRLGQAARRILEVNPAHPLIAALAERVHKGDAIDAVEDVAHVLLDQALIVEGEPPADGAAFARRLAGALARGFAS